ncbi:hypothetical protein ACJMK2_010560 [Sinanodonta woodiana]|uniref:Protein kinase domain-containing protein n=1 Tax=Sinanodonta woodiana TaxID=1069815 RepID=A0ABD3VIQ2_SINWO
MSLASLKEKLTKGKDHYSDESVTFDLTGQTQWLELIFSQGNRPEDWQKFINSVKEGTQFPDDITRYNFICDLYDKAFKEIKADDNRTNETYADLFIDYARLKTKHIPDEALYILSQARAICRKFAIVHVESAEQERRQGNDGKAKKILEKALLFEAKPTEMIKEALRRLKEGRPQLYSPKLSSVFINGGREVSAGIRNVNELSGKKTDIKEESLVDGVKSNTINKDSDTEPYRQPQKVNSKPLLRSYHSTPDMGSAKKIVPSSGSDFFLKRRAADIGLPMRVKKLNMPFHMTDECEEEDDTQDKNTFDGFIPLDASRQSNKTYLSSQGTHTSGYMSMTNTDTIPIEIQDSSTLKQKDHCPEDKHVKVEEVNDNLPKPNIQKPEAEKNQNSRTYSIKRPCQIPPPIQDQLQLPRQVSSQMDHHDQHKLLGISTPSVNSLVAPLQIPSTPNLANLKVMKVNGQSYSVLDIIGQGGSSKVYQVMDLNDSKKKLKAIKCVNLEHANQMIVEGYKNEIKLLKRLQYCDKVIKMYDYEYDAENNKLYVVLEAGNCDLAMFFRSQTKEGKRLSDNLIKFYWEIMLQAVQALHKEGIIHSDLKPANFLMVDGNLKLIDFGIAKALQQDKTSVIFETQVGTLNYMSPEAIMDSCGDPSNKGRPKFKIGVKSDVWSLGCILYNMVYGKTPFQHIRHDFAKLQAIINPEFAIDFPEAADLQVIDVMKKCLHRDPKQRPSIDELLFHPYLIGTKKEEVTEEKKISHLHIEALISKLSDQSTLSPTSLMTIKKLKSVLNKIDNPNTVSFLEMGDEAKNGASNLSQWQNVAASTDNKTNPENNPFRHVNLNRPGKPVQGPSAANVKQIRAPLQSLSIKDYQIPDEAK